MACIIKYNNKKYTQPEFNEYFKSHFFEFAGDFLGSKQDIEGFKKFTSDKIGIKSVGTNDNLTYQFIAVNKILDNIDKVKRWDKQIKDRNAFWNKIQQDLKIPKSQIDLLKEVNGRTIEEKLASFVAEYGYVIEIKTVIGKENIGYEYDYETGEYYTGEKAGENTQYYSNLTVPGGINYIENEIATPLITPSIKGHGFFSTDSGIGWFRGDEKQTLNKQVNKKTTPTKTRRILELQSDLFQKGRDKRDLITQNKQKLYIEETNVEKDPYVVLDEDGRAKGLFKTKSEAEAFIHKDGDDNSPSNKFLQLLNKDNNWVKFFIQSIIQDSAKKGYEKVLFPTGNTASKVEGHTTLEEFRREKEDRIKHLKERTYIHSNLQGDFPFGFQGEYFKTRKEAENYREELNNREIKQLEQELQRVETEGFGALRPIFNFYENTVTNILKKNYPVKQITDEYGNTWNEVEIIPEYTNPIELYNLKSESAGVKSQIPNKELVYDEIKAALIDAGFDVKSLEEASKITGKDYKNVNALVNFAVKMVALSNDANVIDIAEEAAHVAVAHGKLKNISLYNRAIELVKSTDEYREDYDRYKSRYTFEYGADIAESLALEEILGKIVRKHIIEGFDRSSDKGLIRVLKTLWEKFLSLFRKDSLNGIAQKYASDFIKGKVKAENIEQSTEFYSLQKEGVTYKQLLDSLLKREKALTTKKGANVINIRRQIKSIREQIDDLTQLTGTIKFIGYLDQDTQTALSYLKSSFDIATTDEEVSNLQIRLRQLREKYAESPSDELKELIQSTRKNIRLLDKNKYKRITLRSDAAIPSLNHIHQYQELIQYYMPYLKDLKDVMLNQQESLGKRLGIPVSAVGARAIDKQIEKLTMIKEMIDVLTPKALEINLAKDVSDIAGEKETGVDLSQEIAYGSNISSSMWYWFGSLRDSSDTLNRLVSTMMNNIYNLVRRKTLDKATEILTEFKDLIGKDTSWMYEVVDGKRTGRYIDDLLWTSHYNARKKFHKDLHTKYGFPEDSHQRNKLKREINGYANIIKAMKRNSVLSDEDKASIRRMELAMEKLRRYNDEVRTWYKENTVPRTNLTAIIDEARQKLSRNQFREWIDRNIEFNAKDEDVALEAVWNNDPNWYSYVSYYKYNFVQPSNGKIITVENFDGTTSKIKTVDWTNKNYNLLTEDQKKQLARIKEIKKEIDVNLLNIPINDLPPQIYESTMDLLFRNDFPTIWKKLRGHLGSAFVTESDDIQFNPDLYQTDQSLSGYVPIRYTHRMEDPARISTDALSSLVMYYNMATEYNEKSKNFAKFSVILEHVKNRKIITQDKKGNLVTEGSKSWNTRGLEQFLKVHLLGQGKDLLEYETPLGKVNVSKIVQKVSSWIRAKNLGLNFATMFSNFASSEAFLAIERIVGQYLNKDSYAKSYGTLMSNLTDLMNNNANNKIAVLRRTFGLGRDLHTLFNDLDKHLFVRDQPSKFMFYGYEVGDFMTKSIAMLSVLYDYKLHDGQWYSSRELKAMNVTDTDLVNMYDYLTVDKGKISNDIDPKVIDRISNKIQYVANGIDGKITDVDRGAIYQHAIFSMVTIHRNWLFDGISKRFKTEGFNFRTLEYEKGYYRDFPSAFQIIGNFFYSDKRILSLHKAMLKYDSLQPWQKDNVKRLYTEMLMVAGFTVLAVLINQAAGDDDDDDAMDLLAYLSNRMLLEVSSFYNPTEITTAVTSPFVPMRDIELIMDFGKALDFSEIDRGPWKDYTHAQKYFLQWIPGVKGINLIRDPQSANQFLKNKPLKPLYTIAE